MTTNSAGPTANDPVRSLLARWRDDPGGTYRTWFPWEGHLADLGDITRGCLAGIQGRNIQGASAIFLLRWCVGFNGSAMALRHGGPIWHDAIGSERRG